MRSRGGTTVSSCFLLKNVWNLYSLRMISPALLPALHCRTCLPHLPLVPLASSPATRACDSPATGAQCLLMQAYASLSRLLPHVPLSRLFAACFIIVGVIQHGTREPPAAGNNPLRAQCDAAARARWRTSQVKSPFILQWVALLPASLLRSASVFCVVVRVASMLASLLHVASLFLSLLASLLVSLLASLHASSNTVIVCCMTSPSRACNGWRAW